MYIAIPNWLFVFSLAPYKLCAWPYGMISVILKITKRINLYLYRFRSVHIYINVWEKGSQWLNSLVWDIFFPLCFSRFSTPRSPPWLFFISWRTSHPRPMWIWYSWWYGPPLNLLNKMCNLDGLDCLGLISMVNLFLFWSWVTTSLWPNHHLHLILFYVVCETSYEIGSFLLVTRVYPSSIDGSHGNYLLALAQMLLSKVFLVVQGKFYISRLEIDPKSIHLTLIFMHIYSLQLIV